MSIRPMGGSEVTLALGAAAVLGITLALLVDLGGPRGDGATPTHAAASLAVGDDLAERMEAQTAAGAPGVALALDEQAGPNVTRGAAVSAARARAHYDLGDAPKALEIARTGLRICEASGRCSYGERASLMRLNTVYGAVVAAGIKDPKLDPEAVKAALQGIVQVHRAAFVR